MSLDRVTAHGGGFGWDEAMLLIPPLVVLLVLQFAARRRRQREAGEAQAAEGASSPET